MKFNKLILFIFSYLLAGFLLTACQNTTSSVNDQTGKAIQVTSSGSDTYTFKLPAAELEETTPVEIPEEIPEEITEETETIADTTEPEFVEEDADSEGPKTGEP